MEVVKAYDVHANLQAEIHECKRKLIELETLVYTLQDAFFHHTREERDSGVPWDKVPEP